jgi:2-methylcitrate dehydratase PrpD
VTHTAAILDFAAAPHVLPPQVRADALRLLADTLAVMAAGAASDEAAKVRAACADPAFGNGFAIHCLEWDAVHEGAVVHAMSVVTAALLASSHRGGGSDPEAFLTALAVGVDIASGLGIAATGPMRFFRPATAGVIGAALAVARLEQLAPPPALRFADVLGFAYSFAGGTMQAHVEGSIALPLQIGRAAQAAIQAVDFTRAGLTAPHAVLEGLFGYAALIEPLDLSSYTATLGQKWHISDISTKPFPSGRASHGALGALQQLRDHALKGVALHDIAGIVLHAPPLIQRLVGRRYRPGADPSINRLCLGFLAPLMLRDGFIDPRLDTTDASLAGRTEVVVDTNPDGNAMNPQRLVVTLSDGQMIERHIPATLGSPASPMDAATAASKYTLCRDLAGTCDPRLFDDSLAYATDPR